MRRFMLFVLPIGTFTEVTPSSSTMFTVDFATIGAFVFVKQ